MRICPECDLQTLAEVCPNDGRGTIPESLLSGPQRIEKFVGTTLDNKFQILARLGAGGYATVYRAKHLQMGGDVAVKIMEAGNVADPVAIKRFYLEAQNTHKLRHPNTVRVMDFGQTPTGDLYLAMEYLPGQNVKEAVKAEGRLAASRVVRILSQVLKSLGEAHAQGLIHRDVKADNIMLVEQFGEKDFVKVLDFGISRQTTSAHLTHASGTIGTPRNMAPEQWRGEPVDARTDLYAVGCMAYFMLTGQYPFKFGREVSGTTEVVAYMNAHLSDYPAAINDRAPGAATLALSDFVERLLSKDRDDRPSTALEAVAELEAAASEEPLATTVPALSDQAPLGATSIMASPVIAPTASDFSAGGLADEDEATRMLDLTIPGPPSPPPEQTQLLGVGDAIAAAAPEATSLMIPAAVPKPESAVHAGLATDDADVGDDATRVLPALDTGPPPAFKTHAVSTDVVRRANGPAKPKSKAPLFLAAAAVLGIAGLALALSSPDDAKAPLADDGRLETAASARLAGSPSTSSAAASVPVAAQDVVTGAEPSTAIASDAGPSTKPQERDVSDPEATNAVLQADAQSAVETVLDAADVAPKVGEPQAKAPSPVKVTLSSTPPGLNVVLSLTGESLGKTPFVWTMSDSERAKLSNNDIALSFEHADGRRTAGWLKSSAIVDGQAKVSVELPAPPQDVTSKKATAPKKTASKKATTSKKTGSKKKTKRKKRTKKGGSGWGF